MSGAPGEGCDGLAFAGEATASTTSAAGMNARVGEPKSLIKRDAMSRAAQGPGFGAPGAGLTRRSVQLRQARDGGESVLGDERVKLARSESSGAQVRAPRCR